MADDSQSSVGEVLLEFIKNSRHEIVLIAPFIKAAVLDRLLRNIRDDVDVVCVTRWRPAEIFSGVSDLEVYDVIERYHGVLWLRQDLHAKYFRSDSSVLIGSANITSTALGWSSSPNLELLVSMDRAEQELATFEKRVLQSAVQVDSELYEFWTTTMKNVDFEQLRRRQARDSGEVGIPDVDSWMPSTRQPSDLYVEYKNQYDDTRPRATRAAAIQDLGVLQPPENLKEEDFNKVIAATLLTMPMIRYIDRQLVTPQRFGSVRESIREKLCVTNSDASRRCQTLIRWLRYFLSIRYRYERPGYSEIIGRRQSWPASGKE